MQLVPLRDLAARRVGHVLPVLLRGAFRARSQGQLSDDLVLRDALVVEQHELEAQVLQALVVWHVKDEALVENRTGGALLDVRLLFSDALAVVK